MAESDLNILYNARKVVPNHADYSDNWDRLAQAYRQEAGGELDIAYGSSEREKFDFFPAGEKGGPVCVFIHGGYWRSRDRKTYSHIARPLNARGISAAIPSYDLCPNVTIPHIIGQMRACLAGVWERTGVRPVVCGNSAGGHLAGAMLATDWSGVDGVPGDLVSRAIGYSGLFDLRPLVELDINDDLKLTGETAREASPALWPAPRKGLKFVAAVGAEETQPFKDQSRNLANTWNGKGIDTEYYEVPNCNHFSIVDCAFDETTPLFAKLLAMTEAHERA